MVLEFNKETFYFLVKVYTELPEEKRKEYEKELRQLLGSKHAPDKGEKVMTKLLFIAKIEGYDFEDLLISIITNWITAYEENVLGNLDKIRLN